MVCLVTDPLRLVVIDGPGSPGVGPQVGDVLECPDNEAILGRSPECTHHLADPWVSREHARLVRSAGHWTITDCDSTGGTFINGARLQFQQSAELHQGDEITVGPWRLRVGHEPSLGGRTVVLRDHATAGASIHTPTRRLRALSRCIERLVNAPDETSLARAVLESVLEGSGFRRGALLRPPRGSEHAPLILALARDGTSSAELTDGAFSVPSSIVSTAATGHTAVLHEQAMGADISESIVSSSIHSAVCSPVMLDGRVEILIYLDSRGTESPIGDAASFCDDIAQIYAMAMAYRGREQLIAEQAATQAAMERAIALRAMLEPAELVEHGPFCIAHRMSAGHDVAGDLVDIHPQPDGSVIILIGDAMGHGVGAALLTSLAQAHLHAEITRDPDLVSAVERTNTFIARRPTDGSFVTLWAGHLHTDGRVDYVDAGHGHWLIARANTHIEPVDRAAGLPLGVDAEIPYALQHMQLAPADRIVLYTDGIIEQRINDEPIGTQQLHEVIADQPSSPSDVQAAFDLVAGIEMADDATVLSVEFQAS